MADINVSAPTHLLATRRVATQTLGACSARAIAGWRDTQSADGALLTPAPLHDRPRMAAILSARAAAISCARMAAILAREWSAFSQLRFNH